MKILITGFAPFGGEKINPSFEAVKLLPDKIQGDSSSAELIKLELPVEYNVANVILKEKIDEYKPDVCICCGQAGGRFSITPEKVAINYIDAPADNKGIEYHNVKIDDITPDAYFSTLPVEEMVQAIRSTGIPSSLSLSAGAYLCNYIMYYALHFAYTEYPNMKAGFIHVPFITEQVIQRSNSASLPLYMISDGLIAAIKVLLK